MEPIQQKGGSVRWYILGVLVAAELLMSFSFLGYVHVEPISITFAYIPVLLTGALLGPLESTLVGTVFGLASMWKASANYVMDFDQLFSPFLSGRPLESFLLSVGARMLFGLMVGLLYLPAKRVRFSKLWIGAVSYVGQFVHAVLVYTVLFLFFPETGYQPSAALKDLIGAEDIAANLITAAIVLAFWRAKRSKLWIQVQFRLETARKLQAEERYHHLPMAVMVLLTLGFSVVVAFYYLHRIDYVLNQHGASITDAAYSDLIHLQIQFLIGILAMVVLIAVFVIFNRRYAAYMAFEAKMDPLTGVMSRKAFFQSCSSVLENYAPQSGRFGYFIMVDVDWFKNINDHYGHPEGDRVLKEVARNLREIFQEDSLIGRLGGDEFAVLLYTPTSREELEVLLRHFQDRVRRIAWEKYRATCSAGALPIVRRASPEECYRDADQLLYLAKEKGRDRFVIGDPGREEPALEP